MSLQDLLCTASRSWVLRDSSRLPSQPHLAAAKRNRSFGLFETATLRYNLASNGIWRASSPNQDRNAWRLLETVSDGRMSVDELVERVTETGCGFEVNPTKNFVDCITAFNVGHENNNIVERKEAAGIMSDKVLEAGSDLNDQNRIRQSLLDLHEHLKDLRTREDGECDVRHDVMLRMTGFEEPLVATTIKTVPFEILISPCHNATGTGETAVWQATSVRFDRTADHSLWEETMCGLNRIGKLIGYLPGLVIGQQQLCVFHDEHDEESRPPLTDRHIPLRDLLDGRHCSDNVSDNLMAFSRQDRGVLTLNLALSLFYLYDGPWAFSPPSYTADDFIFVASRQSTHTILSGCHKPYIHSNLTDRVTVPYQKSNRPSYRTFFDLAQILMEIHLGHSLSIDSHMPGGFRSSLKEIARRELKDPENAAYKDAIMGCLDLAVKLLTIQTEQLSQKERQFIYDDVITNLKEHCKVWDCSGPEDLELVTESTYETEKEHSAHASMKDPGYSGDVKSDIFDNGLGQSRLCRPPPGLSIFTLFDDTDISTESTKESAREFMRRISIINSQYIIPCEDIVNQREKIKIAVLDSGVSRHDTLIKGAFQMGIIRGGWGPTGTNKDDYSDTYGHGTHVARLLLATAPLAEIYIAKVCDDKYLDESKLQNIVQAFEWALNDDNDVDIISISIGIPKNVPEIEAVIQAALQRKKLIFAAAANDGGLNPRAFPACLPGVICVHACDGWGNRAPFSPFPEARSDNFHTIGVSIESHWDDQTRKKQSGKEGTVFKSGTSFATPVAAGIAANVMEFAVAHLTGPHDNPRGLFEYASMRELLRGISKEFGTPESQFIKPWNLFAPIDLTDENGRRSAWDRVSTELRDFIRSRKRPEMWST